MELGEFAQGEHKTTRMRVSWVGCPRDHQHVRVVDEKERTIEIGKHPRKGRLRNRKEWCPTGKGKDNF